MFSAHWVAAYGPSGGSGRPGAGDPGVGPHRAVVRWEKWLHQHDARIVASLTASQSYLFPRSPLPLLLCRRGRRRRGARRPSGMAASTAPSPSAWLDWAAEYTKAAQAEARPPPEWAARVAAASAGEGGGDVPWSAGLAEMLAGALLSGGGAAAWKYAEAALAARLASPPLLIALLSTRYVPETPASVVL